MHLPWRLVAPGDGPKILTSVATEEAAELARLAAGRQVLEIGSAYGYSAVVMARAGAHVTAVDPHNWIPHSYESMLGNLAAYGAAGQVEIIREYSQQAMPWLEAEGLAFGLVFIDGDHSEDAVAHDVGHALRLLAPGGVLACHDYHEDTCPGVAAALDRVFPGGPDTLTGTLFTVAR